MIKELLVVLRTRRQVDSELEFQIKLAADNGDANNQFGMSIAANGKVIIVIAEDNDDKESHSRATCACTRDGIMQFLQAKLVLDDRDVNDRFSRSAAMDSDNLINAFERGKSGLACLYSRVNDVVKMMIDLV